MTERHPIMLEDRTMGYAIVTRYHGPTNYRGSRVIGTGPAPSLGAWDAPPHSVPLTRATVGWDYGAGNPARDDEPAAYGGAYDGWGDSDANHRRAADAVVAKLRAAGWTVALAPDDRGASLPDESGRVYVLRYRSDAVAITLSDEARAALLRAAHADEPASGWAPGALADGIAALESAR